MSTSAPTHVVEVNGDAIERYVVAPQDVGLELSAPDAVAGGTPDVNAATTRAILAGEPGPARGLALLNAGAAIYAAGRGRQPARGRRRPRARRSTRAPRCAPPTPTSSCRGSSRTAMSVLERIVDATRADVARRRQAVPARPSSSSAPPAAARTALLRGAHAAGHLGHRRAQAPLAERRRDPPRRDGGRDRRRLRARRRRGAVDPHRGAPLRRLAGRPARGARGQRAADPAQGLHRRPLPGLRVDGGRRRRDPAHRRGARRRRPEPPAPRGASGLDLDVLVEVHDEDELERALDVVDADVIGINNRDLGDFTVDVERTYELLSDVPAGKTVVSESGFHSREQLDDLERVGVDAVLIGEGLMRASDVEAACRALTGLEGGESEAL